MHLSGLIIIAEMLSLFFWKKLYSELYTGSLIGNIHVVKSSQLGFKYQIFSK